jgi:integral membrane sensor domain MASE1
MSDLGQFILIHFAVHVPPLAGGVIAIIVLVVIIHLFRDRIF